jgi:hypothetical protein
MDRELRMGNAMSGQPKPTLTHRAGAMGPEPAADQRLRPHSLVSLVSRLLVAQAGASAGLGVAFSRRNLPWLLLVLGIAVAVAGLAALVRSGSHTSWLAAITAESALVGVGLFRFAYAQYLGGTLLAIITLGTLLHPAVARAFTPLSRGAAAAADHLGLADGAGELQGSAAGS